VTHASVRLLRAGLPAAALLAALHPAAAQRPAELPRAHAPRPTAAPIAAADVMTRLYILADDSMMGRESGTEGNRKATDYVAAEFRRMGLEPAGDGGSYFQEVPLRVRGPEPGARLSAGGAELRHGTDFLPVGPDGQVFPFAAEFAGSGVPVVFGGRVGGEMISVDAARGKFVVLLPPMGSDGRPSSRFWTPPARVAYPGAAAVAVASLDISAAGLVRYVSGSSMALASGDETPPAGAPGVLLSAAAAQRLLGADPATLRPGAAAGTVSGAWRFSSRPPAAPARNVVALLRGSDPALRGQVVAIGAHNDHEGFAGEAVDHDSLRAYNRVMRPQGANDPAGTPTPEQWARIRAVRDSLGRLHPPRLDSIYNGADDDGSGTALLLEIAEAMAGGPRPRRTVVFVSHTAEEKGLYGSEWFTDHPTVPRDSIVAALNMDMVGRGRAEDVQHGGPASIQMIGSRRLSTQLGELIDALNAGRDEKMEIDYSFDAAGHPLNRYCRSDHFSYARYGIPITYFSLGYHVDYHMVTDEPQYIDYDHSARVGRFVRDVAAAVANRDARLVVDGPRQDPNAPCRQ
jgi:hypothetical protein